MTSVRDQIRAQLADHTRAASLRLPSRLERLAGDHWTNDGEQVRWTGLPSSWNVRNAARVSQWLSGQATTLIWSADARP